MQIKTTFGVEKRNILSLMQTRGNGGNNRYEAGLGCGHLPSGQLIISYVGLVTLGGETLFRQPSGQNLQSVTYIGYYIVTCFPFRPVIPLSA